MPTDNLDSIIRTWTRANPVEVHSMETAMAQVDENIARARRTNDLDFESMFATVISEHMTQNNLDLTRTLIQLGFTETSLIFAISRWYRTYTGERL